MEDWRGWKGHCHVSVLFVSLTSWSLWETSRLTRPSSSFSGLAFDSSFPLFSFYVDSPVSSLLISIYSRQSPHSFQSVSVMGSPTQLEELIIWLSLLVGAAAFSSQMAFRSNHFCFSSFTIFSNITADCDVTAGGLRFCGLSAGDVLMSADGNRICVTAESRQQASKCEFMAAHRLSAHVWHLPSHTFTFTSGAIPFCHV